MGAKRFIVSGKPAGWEPLPDDSSQRRQQNRQGVAASDSREFPVVERAVGLGVDTVGREARKSKRNVRKERRQRDRCKCGRVAVVVKSSLTDGTTAWCLKCLEAGKQAEPRKPRRQEPRDWPEELTPEENLRKLQQKELREEAERLYGPGWKKGNPKGDSLERSRW